MIMNMRMGRRFSIFLIIVIAVGIRAYRADEPFGGFHGFNEAWYAIVAENYAGGSLLYPTSYEGTVDYNVPPLFSWVVYAVYRVAGPGEAQTRAVSIFFSVVLILFVIWLGERMYGGRAGLAAGALVAAMPMSVIVGRNAQVDMMYAALLAGFVYVYALMRDEGRRGLWLVAGFLLGAAVLAKQPAALGVVVVVVWEVLGRRNWRFIDRKFIGMSAVALVMILAFYLPHLIRHSSEIFGAQAGGALRLAEVPDAAVAHILLADVWWGFSPVVAVIVLWALPYDILRLRRAGSLPVIGFAVHAIAFVFLHKHTYYAFPAMVFAAVVAGRLWGGERQVKLKGALLAAVVGCALLTSLLLLCRVKYGWHVFHEFGGRLEARDIRGVDVVVDDVLLGSYGSLVRYYAPGSRVFRLGGLPMDETGTADLNYEKGFVVLFDAARPFFIPHGMRMEAGIDIMGVGLFGRDVYTHHAFSQPSPHRLGSSYFVVKRAGPGAGSGIRRVGSREAVKFVYLPPEYRLRMVGGRLKIVIER